MILQTSRFRQLSVLTALAAGIFLSGQAWAADSTSTADVVSARTRPSEESRLAFALPGLVTDVAVKDGDHVKAGQVLAQQDDRQDQAALNSMQLDAKSLDEIHYSTIDKGVKQVQLQRKQQMLSDHVASQSEVEEAQLAVELADAQINLSKVKHEMKVLDAQKQQVKVDQMRMTSPFDGIIQKVNVHTGEMADPQNHDGAILVIKNNPLWIEMHLPTNQSQQLKMNDPLQVKYPDDKEWQTAKVTYLAPEADAASKTQEVRLELPNPSGKDSGLEMQVKLPENVLAATALGN